MNLELKKNQFYRESHFLQFWHWDKDYQEISQIDLSGPNYRFPSKMAKNNFWPAIFDQPFELFILFKFQGNQMSLKKFPKWP